ncbi:MAG: phytanoyl-CoA dioxygenase family protein [Anaerolineae bacterium]|nr:phytanoyl-CoA dioxygenase family protein [Anaerolineae bacterium]
MTDKPFLISNDALQDPTQLRQRMTEHGYVFLKGVAPKDDLLNLRRDILALCADAGWLDPSRDLMDGIWGGIGPYTEGNPEYMAVYRHVIHLDSFKALPEHPALTGIMRHLTGDPLLVHRRKIGRMTFPQNTKQTIQAHQDWYYIRGTTETYTMWMPLGDCSMELGGLAVLNGSHKAGFIDHRRLPEVNVAYALESDQWPQAEGVEWHASDFELGDVLIFHSYTIHRALPNRTENLLRLSIDNRYQREGSDIEPGSLGTHYDL